MLAPRCMISRAIIRFILLQEIKIISVLIVRFVYRSYRYPQLRFDHY